MRYSIDIDSRIKVESIEEVMDVPMYVSFVGDVTEESAKKFRDDMIMAENAAKRSKQDIIPIIIDSYGGSVYALLSMVDTIRNCPYKVATIVESKAMSAGTILFSCGAEGHRYVAPNATVMVHDVASFAAGKQAELKASSEEAERLNKLIYEIMAKNCGHKDPSYFFDMVSKKRGADWYLTPDECVAHNLANHVRIPSMNLTVKMEHSFG
jgi:ATP-dependent Clp protease, protease subunit